LYDRQVSLTCNLDVLCVHPALHADTQPAAFFKRGSARFRIFGSKLDIGHHTLFIIYKQLCGLFQNVRKHRRDNSAPCLAVLDKYNNNAGRRIKRFPRAKKRIEQAKANKKTARKLQMQAAFIFHHINPPCKAAKQYVLPSLWQLSTGADVLHSFRIFFLAISCLFRKCTSSAWPHLCNLFSPLYQHRRHKFSFLPF